MHPLLIIFGVLICLGAATTFPVAGIYLGMFESFLLSAPSQAASLTDGPERSALERMIQFAPLLHGGVISLALIYLFHSVVWGWIGVGLMLPRRWAHQLLMAHGWMALGTTALTLVVFLTYLPAVNEVIRAISTSSVATGGPAPPVGTITTFIAGYFVFLILMGAVPTVIVIIVMGLRSVRLTCAYLDPEERWTDRVPVQVLPLCFGAFLLGTQLLSWVPMLSQLSMVFGPEFPAWAAVLGVIILGGGLLWSAWLVARMQALGWWVILVLASAGSAMALFFIKRFQISEFWTMAERLGMPQEDRIQAEQGIPLPVLQALEALATNWIPVLVFAVAIFGYLGWIKSYFEPSSKEKSPS